jgi:hypothetical protein
MKVCIGDYHAGFDLACWYIVVSLRFEVHGAPFLHVFFLFDLTIDNINGGNVAHLVPLIRAYSTYRVALVMLLYLLLFLLFNLLMIFISSNLRCAQLLLLLFFSLFVIHLIEFLDRFLSLDLHVICGRQL